jgi:YD repeat-containing protein
MANSKGTLGQIRDVRILDGNDNFLGTPDSPLSTSGGASFDLFLPEYDANNNPIYVCTAVAGTATSAGTWQIFKLAYDANGNITKKRYADGTADFTKVADDYLTFDYTDI